MSMLSANLLISHSLGGPGGSAVMDVLEGKVMMIGCVQSKI